VCQNIYMCACSRTMSVEIVYTVALLENPRNLFKKKNQWRRIRNKQF